MTNTSGRVENTKNDHWKVRMTERRIAFTTKVSMLVIAATMLAACGGGSSGSGGAAQVSVPNVVGDTQAAATTAVTGAGLTVGAVTQASSATVASGNVISETPAAGTSTASGSSVALVVSTGPASVSVPNVVGDTQAAATTALTGAGLTVGTVTKQSSGTVASGDVISENPSAKTSVVSGSTVALVISTGPLTYTIGGTVIGLGAGATVHVLNGSDNVPISANGSFYLPTAVASGKTYRVTAGTPTSTQTCAVQNASGTIASANVTNVAVYCTYNVNAATLKATFTSVGARFNDVASGVNYPYDYVSADTFDGVSAISSTFTLNVAGSIMPGQTGTSTYTVTTASAIPSYTDNSPVWEASRAPTATRLSRLRAWSAEPHRKSMWPCCLIPMPQRPQSTAITRWWISVPS
jgi:PASTA domain